VRGAMQATKDTSILCPKCGSEYVVQTHRLQIKKWITTRCKYVCTDCGKQFYMPKPKTTQVDQNTIPQSERFFHFFRS